MASNYTSNYSLCQWAASDKVLRTEFNADNAKIDAAIKAVDGRVDDKASVSALNSLKTTVSGLSGTLERKGNCRVIYEVYTGNGAETNTRTFPGNPLLVVLCDGTNMIIALRGMITVYNRGSGSSAVNVSWSGNTMTLSSTKGATYILNGANWTYHCLALLDTEE